MIDLLKYKDDLENNKAFRDSEMRRLILLRKASQDNNTYNACNLILNYIYDLNYRAVFNQNNKNA